jgi:prepilin-type N-terminal cleavage/methylation domain-containing protein
MNYRKTPACATSRRTHPRAETAGRRHPDRREGFTLIELLVVIFIILIVSAVALPTVLSALNGRDVSEGGRIVQGGLVGARDSAIHNNAPSGIRLLPDPAFPVHWLDPNNSNDNAFLATYPGLKYQVDPRTILAANRFVPLEPVPDYNTGRVQIYPSNYYTSLPFLPTGAQVLVVEQSQISVLGQPPNQVTIPNDQTSWFWNIRCGDKIQIGDTENIYTVVGPIEINAGPNPTLGNNGGNSELFVNATAYPTRYVNLAINTNTVTISSDYLYVVNGKDDDSNGVVDDGNNGIVSGSGTQYYEPEKWLGEYSQLKKNFYSDLAYNITRRPAPVSRGREVSLPTNVVIDLTTWNTNIFAAGSERSRLPVNPYTGCVDILVNPDGTVVPTTIFSSPASFGMGGAFFHLWLADRSDVVAPVFPVAKSSPPYLPVPQGLAPTLFGGQEIKGNYGLLTLFSRTGQISANQNMTFDAANVGTTSYNLALPFVPAQQGISGGQ